MPGLVLYRPGTRSTPVRGIPRLKSRVPNPGRSDGLHSRRVRFPGWLAPLPQTKASELALLFLRAISGLCILGAVNRFRPRDYKNDTLAAVDAGRTRHGWRPTNRPHGATNPSGAFGSIDLTRPWAFDLAFVSSTLWSSHWLNQGKARTRGAEPKERTGVANLSRRTCLRETTRRQPRNRARLEE